MAEQDPSYGHQPPVERIKKPATSGPGKRGVHLRGLWSCRVLAGVTQRELGEMIGSHQSTIHALEHQHRGAYMGTVQRLCKALGVDPVDLVCGEPSEDSR
jgi:DNA-binding Xre family transcriptional regulator